MRTPLHQWLPLPPAVRCGTLWFAAEAGGSPAEEQPDGEVESDLPLIKAARAGDREAFSELVNRHRTRVHAVILNMVRNEADAWDLCQEVFIKAWQALDRFEGRSAFFTWLYRIAHNLTCDWLRRRKNRTSGGFDETWQAGDIAAGADVAPSPADAPDEGLHRADLRQALEQALDRISPDHRQAILLKEVQGLKYREIAEVMNCSIGTVMSRLFHARKNLQELLAETHAEFRGTPGGQANPENE